MLTATGHIFEAHSCMQSFEYLRQMGRHRQASELLWSAMKHALNAAAIQCEYKHGTYAQKKALVKFLAAESGRSDLTESFLRDASQIHADADKFHMELSDLMSKQNRVAGFVEEFIAIAATLNNTPRQPN